MDTTVFDAPVDLRGRKALRDQLRALLDEKDEKEADDELRQLLGGWTFNVDDLIDEKAVARWLKVSVRTVQAWRVSGDGPPFVRLNRAVRYRRGDVSAYLARRTVASTSQVAA